MPKKIPIRIYKIDSSEVTDSGISTERVDASLQAYEKLPGSRYVQNVTEDDISMVPSRLGGAFRKIALNGDFLPGSDLDEYKDFTVQEDKFGKLYVEYNNERYYIRRTQLSKRPDDTGPDIFEFYVNPEHITPTYKKLVTEIRTRGGYEVQHWGNALTDIRVQGKSGGLHRVINRPIKPGNLGETLQGDESIMDSSAWKRLMQLKRLYDFDHVVKNQQSPNVLGMNYHNSFFIGYFTDFTGPEADAKTPYLVNYSFSFRVQKEYSNVRSS